MRSPDAEISHFPTSLALSDEQSHEILGLGGGGGPGVNLRSWQSAENLPDPAQPCRAPGQAVKEIERP